MVLVGNERVDDGCFLWARLSMMYFVGCSYCENFRYEIFRKDSVYYWDRQVLLCGEYLNVCDIQLIFAKTLAVSHKSCIFTP